MVLAELAKEELHRHRHFLRRRHVQRRALLPVHSVAHVQPRARAATSSIQRSARWCNEPATRVKAIKEETLDLTPPGGDKIDKALHIYYDNLIESLVEELSRAVAQQKLPRTDQPLPIVLAGGTAKPKGFRDRFEKALRRRPLPFQIGDVRMASDPLTATARGALVAALAER